MLLGSLSSFKPCLGHCGGHARLLNQPIDRNFTPQVLQEKVIRSTAFSTPKDVTPNSQSENVLMF